MKLFGNGDNNTQHLASRVDGLPQALADVVGKAMVPHIERVATEFVVKMHERLHEDA